PASRITDDREHRGAAKAVQQVLDFSVASEEQPRVFRVEDLQAAKRAVAAPVIREKAVVGCAGPSLLDRGQKPIAWPGDGLNEPMAVSIVSQGLPQNKDVLGEIPLFDIALRPERCHQFLFLEDPTAVHHQERERIKHFRCKGYRLAVAHQYPLREIELESAELVDHAGVS